MKRLRLCLFCLGHAGFWILTAIVSLWDERDAKAGISLQAEAWSRIVVRGMDRTEARIEEYPRAPKRSRFTSPDS